MYDSSSFSFLSVVGVSEFLRRLELHLGNKWQWT